LRSIFYKLLRHVDAVFLIISLFLIIYNLLLVWGFTFIPFQDHPSHLLRENVLLNYNNPKYDYNRNFDININPVPNVLSDIAVYLLGLLFPLKLASKLFYSIYIIFFPLSFFYFITRIFRQSRVYVLFAILYTYSFFACMGNENFLMSLILFFCLWGLVLDENRIPIRKILVFILIQLLYLSHMFTFYIAFISISSYLIFNKKIREIFYNILFFLPGIVLFGWWQLSERGTLVVKKNVAEMILFSFNKIKTLLISLAPYTFYDGYTAVGLIFFCVIVLVIYGVKVSANEKLRKMFYVFIVILLNIFLPTTLFFYGPDQRSFFIANLFAVILFPLKNKIRYSVCFILLIVNIYSAVANYDYFKWSNIELKGIVKDFKKIPRGLKILPVVCEPYIWSCASHRVFEYYHLLKGGINPYHFFTGNNIVCYKNPPPVLDIYAKTTDQYTQSLLDCFDAVMVIGNRFDPQAAELIYFFKSRGFSNTIIKSSSVFVLKKE